MGEGWGAAGEGGGCTRFCIFNKPFNLFISSNILYCINTCLDMLNNHFPIPYGKNGIFYIALGETYIYIDCFFFLFLKESISMPTHPALLTH